MLRAIAELAKRVAASVGDPGRQPGRSRYARIVYRIAGAVIARCGGRLESRVIFFVLPPAEAPERLEEVVGKIEAALQNRGIAVRVSRTRLSAEEAASNADLADLAPPDGDVTLFEIFVPPHRFWSAIDSTQNVLKSLS